MTNFKEIIEKHNNVVIEYCEDHDEEEKMIVKDLNSFLDKIVNKIADFGYGETEFHTADIELMYKIIKEMACKEANRK